MLISALISFGILVISWMVLPSKRPVSNTEQERRPAFAPDLLETTTAG